MERHLELVASFILSVTGASESESLPGGGRGDATNSNSSRELSGDHPRSKPASGCACLFPGPDVRIRSPATVLVPGLRGD